MYYVSTSHEYVVGVISFPQCVSLIKLNAWEDERFVLIKVFRRREKEEEKDII
jgi:hypothetical protein